MVHVQLQQMLLCREPEQQRAQQRACAEVERADGMLAGQAQRLGLAVLAAGEIDLVDLEGNGRRDDLDGRALVLAERGPQGLVAAHQLGEGLLQGARVQRALQSEGHRHVVVGRARLQPVQEPQPLLSEGQRE